MCHVIVDFAMYCGIFRTFQFSYCIADKVSSPRRLTQFILQLLQLSNFHNQLQLLYSTKCYLV